MKSDDEPVPFDSLADAWPEYVAEDALGGPMPEPEAAFEPIAEPEPVPSPAPAPEPAPAAEPEPQPIAAPEPGPLPVPPPEPEPLPVSPPEPEPAPPPAPEPEPDEVLEETDLGAGPAMPTEPELPRARRGGPTKTISTTFAAAAWTPPAPVTPPVEPAAPTPPPAAAPGAIPGWGQAASPAQSASTPPPTAPPGAIPGWGRPAQPAPPAQPLPPPITPAAPPPRAPEPPPEIPVAPPPVAPIAPPPVAPVQPPPVQPAAVRPTAPVAPVQPAARPPQAVSDQPAARLPTAAVAPKPKPVATVEQRVAQPGDRICGSCGEPNDPTRKFCRRCGASLTEAKIVAATKLPWYRRIFGGGEKKPKQYAAGERIDSMSKSAPKGKGGLRGIFKSIGLVRGLLGLVVMLGIFGYIGIPSFQGAINGVVETVKTKGVGGIVDGITGIVSPQVVAVRPKPESIEANGAVKDHPVKLLFDLAINTDWQTAEKAPEVTLAFEQPVELRSVIVRTGALKQFTDFRRASKIAIVFADGSTKEIDLQDVPDPQTIEVTGPASGSLTVRILASTGPEAAPVAMSEIEFFAKKP